MREIQGSFNKYHYIIRSFLLPNNYYLYNPNTGGLISSSVSPDPDTYYLYENAPPILFFDSYYFKTILTKNVVSITPPTMSVNQFYVDIVQTNFFQKTLGTNCLSAKEVIFTLNSSQNINLQNRKAFHLINTNPNIPSPCFSVEFVYDKKVTTIFEDMYFSYIRKISSIRIDVLLPDAPDNSSTPTTNARYEAWRLVRDMVISKVRVSNKADFFLNNISVVSFESPDDEIRITTNPPILSYKDSILINLFKKPIILYPNEFICFRWNNNAQYAIFPNGNNDNIVFQVTFEFSYYI